MVYPNKMNGYTVLGSTFYHDVLDFDKIDGVTFPVIGAVSGTGDIKTILEKYPCVSYNYNDGSFIAGSDYDLSTPSISDGTFYVKRHSCASKSVGKTLKVAGINAYWMGLHEDMTYPTRAQIDNIFDIALKLKANTIRSHTLGFSSGHPNTLLETDDAFAIVDYAYYKAKMTGIKLIVPFTDNYNYYHGGYGDYGPKNEFFTSPQSILRFKNYISRYLNHVNPLTNTAIKDCSELLYVEFGNELGNIRPDIGSLYVPTRKWLVEILAHVKSISNVMVLDCCDEEAVNSQSATVGFDALNMHVYYNSNRLESLLSYGTPVILGEVGVDMPENYLRSIEPLVSGSILWGVYPDGLKHDDGYTVNWGDSRLLKWSNHFRRLQGINEISFLY